MVYRGHLVPDSVIGSEVRVLRSETSMLCHPQGLPQDEWMLNFLAESPNFFIIPSGCANQAGDWISAEHSFLLLSSWFGKVFRSEILHRSDTHAYGESVAVCNLEENDRFPEQMHDEQSLEARATRGVSPAVGKHPSLVLLTTDLRKLGDVLASWAASPHFAPHCSEAPRSSMVWISQHTVPSV